MVLPANQDPWTRVKTRHGLAADEVISALQKEIRRGHTENAALLAHEMMTTSAELEAKMWQRLLVISVEDIGWGNLQAPNLVYTLYRMQQCFAYGEGDRRLFAIHAVRFLCSCTKDRSSDELLNWLQGEVEAGRLLPEIPDYALDMHTARGQARGRDLRYFLEEAAKIEPELAGRDTTYRRRLLELLKRQE